MADIKLTINGKVCTAPAGSTILQAAERLAHENGALLMLDEVQTGIYRCGDYPFAFQHFGVTPDIVSIAKGIASGFPTGLCAARESVARAFEPGDHGSTFGGSCLAIAAASATLAAIDKLYFYASLWIFERAIDPRTFSTAVREFRLVQRVFDSPSGRKRAALSTAERLVCRERFSLVGSMSHRARPEDTSDFDNRDHRPWENPFTHEVSTASFWDLYDAARARVLPTVAELLAPEFDLAAARELTADLNFEGKPTPSGEKVAW